MFFNGTEEPPHPPSLEEIGTGHCLTLHMLSLTSSSHCMAVRLRVKSSLCPASSGDIKRGYLAEVGGPEHIGLQQE